MITEPKTSHRVNCHMLCMQGIFSLDGQLLADPRERL